MKGNDGSGNNVERDVWETPSWIFEKLKKQFKFNFDCCASNENAKCFHYTKDFLSIKDMEEMSWMNPPFSKASEMFEHFFKVIRRGVAIYRCDNMESKVWQEIILKNADWIFIPNKRVAYEWKGNKQASPRFPSALIGIGVEPPINMNGSLLKTGGVFLQSNGKLHNL